MIFLPGDASKKRQKEAENARRNRAEIVANRSWGKVTRRDLFKWGIFTAGGFIAAQNGLSPFAKSAFGQVPTGTPLSPFPRRNNAGVIIDLPYIQPLLRLHNLTRHPLTRSGTGSNTELVWPAALGESNSLRRANTTTILHKVNLANAANNGNVSTPGTTGPQEGRPPGEAFAHQRWNELVNGGTGLDGRVSNPLPPVGVRMCTGQITPGVSYNLANNWPAQNPSAIWTPGEPVGADRFVRGANWIANGDLTFPALMQARYGESVMLRHYNNMPFFDPGFGTAGFPNNPNSTNGGFGRQEPTTHNHNGHNGAESDGAGNAHFFPGQYYDYLYSLMLARRDGGLIDSIGRNVDTLIGINRADNRASAPTDDGGIVQVPGDFRETQGTLWFHDHRISFTSENVYKGYASMLEYFSGADRGYERALSNVTANNVNLRYPSGFRNGKTWGNRDFDVYLIVQDVAFAPDGQLFFDVFETDGFLGDVMHVNFQWKPVLKVLPRKYRFRILSAGMSRWVKLALVDSLDPNTANTVPVDIIANDGNLFPQRVRNQSELSIQGTAERLDIVVDFSRGLTGNTNLNNQVGKKYYLVNMLEFQNGRVISKTFTPRQALAGTSPDPAVGAIMQFEVASSVQSIDDPTVANTIANACGSNDQSQVNDPGAAWEIPTVTPVRTRVFDFVRGAAGGGLPFDHPDGEEPWGVKVNNKTSYQADMRRVSNLPRPGDIEHWTIKSANGWGHPIHLHFEEAKTLSRKGGRGAIPATELNKRKDVWSIGHDKGDYTFQTQFGEFGGAYVNHCHNTVHEDNAMLMRYDLIKGNSNANIEAVHVTVLPTPDPRPEGVTYVKSCFLSEGNPQGFSTGVDVCPEPDIGPVVPTTAP
mgnify:CR=1 FL=1